MRLQPEARSWDVRRCPCRCLALARYPGLCHSRKMPGGRAQDWQCAARSPCRYRDHTRRICHWRLLIHVPIPGNSRRNPGCSAEDPSEYGLFYVHCKLQGDPRAPEAVGLPDLCGQGKFAPRALVRKYPGLRNRRYPADRPIASHHWVLPKKYCRRTWGREGRCLLNRGSLPTSAIGYEFGCSGNPQVCELPKGKELKHDEKITATTPAIHSHGCSNCLWGRRRGCRRGASPD